MKVISVDVHLFVCVCVCVYVCVCMCVCVCVCGPKKCIIYFSDRLAFSNIRGRTSRRTYRLALPLHTPETLSSLSKSRISLFNVHLTLFVRRMTQITVTQSHR